MVWPRVLGHGDQGAFLDHPVTCAEWLAKKPRRDEKTTSKKCSQGAGVSSRVRKQDLGRDIMQTNLLTSVTFAFLDKLFCVWDLFSHLRSYNISLYLRYLLLCLCLAASMGLRFTEGHDTNEGWFISKPEQ